MIPSALARLVNGLDPMAGVIQGFRWALLGTGMPDGMMLVSVGVVRVLLVTGLYHFRRMEESFADLVRGRS